MSQGPRATGDSDKRPPLSSKRGLQIRVLPCVSLFSILFSLSFLHHQKSTLNMGAGLTSLTFDLAFPKSAASPRYHQYFNSKV